MEPMRSRDALAGRGSWRLRGSHSGAGLTVELGELRLVSRIELQVRGGACHVEEDNALWLWGRSGRALLQWPHSCWISSRLPAAAKAVLAQALEDINAAPRPVEHFERNWRRVWCKQSVVDELIRKVHDFLPASTSSLSLVDRTGGRIVNRFRVYLVSAASRLRMALATMSAMVVSGILAFWLRSLLMESW